jgi:hypothetical protein
MTKKIKFNNVDSRNPKTSLNASKLSVISEKRKSVSPVVQAGADLIEVVGSPGCDDLQLQAEEDFPVVDKVFIFVK